MLSNIHQMIFTMASKEDALGQLNSLPPKRCTCMWTISKIKCQKIDIKELSLFEGKQRGKQRHLKKKFLNQSLNQFFNLIFIIHKLLCKKLRVRMISFKGYYLLLFLAVACLAQNHNQIKTPSMTVPTLLYSGAISGQTVMIDYSGFVSNLARSVQFLIFTNIGGSNSGAIQSFIKLSNELDYHYMRVMYHHETSISDTQSSTMVFPITQSKKIVLECQKSFPKTINQIAVYYVGNYL